MKITACVIVKNEEKNITRWIESMRLLADKLIIVDTGSSDNTRNIALAHNANVYDFNWCDDFSAAKNYALSKVAGGDYILFFDADEYFNADVAKCLKKYMEEYLYNSSIDAFLCKLINIDEDNNNNFLSSFYQLRIFKNRFDFSYVGTIHEQLKNKGKAVKLATLPDNVFVYHTGYSNKISFIKTKRNLSLLQREITLHGKNPELYPYMANCYFSLGDYERAITYWQLFIKSGIKMIGAELYVFAQYIDALTLAKYSNKKIIAAISYALSKYPESADLHYKKGISLYNIKDYNNAEKFLKQALLLYSDDSKRIASRMKNYLFMLYAILAKISALKGEKLKAIKYYCRSLETNARSQFFLDFYYLVSEYSLKVKIKLFNKIYSKNNIEDVLPILIDVGEYRLYAYYKSLYQIDNNNSSDNILICFATGKYSTVVRKIIFTLDILYKNIIKDALKEKKNITRTEQVLLPENY